MSASRNPTIGELGRGRYLRRISCGRQPPRLLSHLTLVQLGQSRPLSCSFGASEPQIATQRYNWNPRRDHTIWAFISTDTPSLYQGSQMKVSLSTVISGVTFLGGLLFSLCRRSGSPLTSLGVAPMSIGCPVHSTTSAY